MWCDKFKCTLSTDACIKRQQLNVTGYKKLEFGDSLNTCRDCLKGKQVLEKPQCYINRDVGRVATKHRRTQGEHNDRRKTINERRTKRPSTKQRNTARVKSNNAPSNRIRIKDKQRKRIRNMANRRSKRVRLRQNQ